VALLRSTGLLHAHAACQDDMQQYFEMRVERSAGGYYVFLSDAITARLSYLERCPSDPDRLIKTI